MGQDKALLHNAGRPLVEHAVRLLQTAGFVPHILGTRPDLAAYAPVIPDLHPGCGPLAGIEAALTASSSDWNMFIAVDLPFLPPLFLDYLAARTAITGASATIPTLAGRPQPLCAIYHRNLLPGITHAVKSGAYKVTNWIESAMHASQSKIDLFGAEALAVTRDNWSLEVPLHRWFQNMNTPADMSLIS
jgi:molybdopterin-guanine dinucleotide biosynthesis protein A